MIRITKFRLQLGDGSSTTVDVEELYHGFRTNGGYTAKVKDGQVVEFHEGKAEFDHDVSVPTFDEEEVVAAAIKAANAELPKDGVVLRQTTSKCFNTKKNEFFILVGTDFGYNDGTYDGLSYNYIIK